MQLRQWVTSNLPPRVLIVGYPTEHRTNGKPGVADRAMHPFGPQRWSTNGRSLAAAMIERRTLDLVRPDHDHSGVRCRRSTNRLASMIMRRTMVASR